MALIPKMGWAGRKGKGEVHRQEGFSFVHQPLYGGPALTWIGALLGRRQAVRQRLLMPPCAGSNPAAPANKLLKSLIYLVCLAVCYKLTGRNGEISPLFDLSAF